MKTCTRRIQFCAGHRVHGHESKCSNLHGHNYVAFITAEATDLDEVGRVIDFSVLKSEVGGWIDDYWDHGMILKETDPALAAVKATPSCANGSQKLYVMRENPTAENMAAHLLSVAGPLLHRFGVAPTKVVLWETENCYAEAVRP